MKKTIFGALALLFVTASCSKEDTTCPTTQVPYLVTPALSTTNISNNQSPLTGILEAYPCHAGSSIYFGNYVYNTLTVFNGYYRITDGHVTGDHNREISLPIDTYNMVYWGTPKYEEPIYTSPAISHPGISVGADMSQLYFKLRPYANDTTYIPVYDLVYAVKETSIGHEDLQAPLQRVVAGLKVTVKDKDNGILNADIERMDIYIGGIAEKLNFYTARPENMTKTVKFELARSVDGTTMSNAMIMLFPSAENPLLKLAITLKDGSVHTLSKNLNSTLNANTKLNLNISIGNIFSGGSSGDFTIENWNESTEEIEFPVVD